ncbi:CG11380, partial [Drosophila busckii]
LCLFFAQCTLSALACLASALASPEPPTKSSSSAYPKKVTTLKKRPTKTPTSSTSSTSSASHATSRSTSKPSKPRVKISSILKAATTSTTTTKATVKTTKSPALDATFSNLPADDLEFIKELDKQFKLHGNKIKIKVERDNSTAANKNSKRTIDGELGYGYAHAGYDYTPPKFMFYPYSQHDIPATESPEAETYAAYSPAMDYEESPTPPQHQQVTSVTIEPSYSYELKPQTSYETHHQQQEQQQQQHHQQQQPETQPQIDLPQAEADGYQEPVIVLRIPGPAKYAAHLQTLLQQYLEIRAAQYLQLLQEAEQRKQQQEQEQQQPEEHLPQPYATQEQHEQAHYHPDVSYAHQLAPTPPPVQYGAIDDVYQSYKGRHQYEQPATAPEHAYYTHAHAQAHAHYQPQPQFYYAQPQEQPQQHYEQHYQPQLYLIAMAPGPGPAQAAAHYGEPAVAQAQEQAAAPQQQPIYVPEQEPAAAPVEHDLPITENNPRSTHTKVIFNPPSSYASYEQQQSSAHQSSAAVAEPAADYQPPSAPSSAGSEEGITQPPYNYHAHGLKMLHGMRQGKRSAGNEQQAEHQLQQIREYVREKLGAEMGSAVEYKTTQLLEG